MKKVIKSNFKDVRCDFCDDQNFWSVDAWVDDDDNSEGKVVAMIDELTGRVIYLDKSAKTDALVQEVVQEKLREFAATSPRIGYESDIFCVHFPTAAGDLVAQFERSEVTGAGYDGVFVGLHPTEDPTSYFDLTGAIVRKGEDAIEHGGIDSSVKVMAFGDLEKEDPTAEVELTDEEFYWAIHGDQEVA